MNRIFTASIAILLIATIASTVFKSPSTENLEEYNNEITRINFSDMEVIPVVDAVGPESLTFGVNGDGPYTGLSDGRIVKWDSEHRRWVDFAITSPNREECGKQRDHEKTEHICGRPLGLKFNQKTGDLYIADAYMGLLVVGSEGGLAKPVAEEAEGVPLRFTNGIDIDQDNGLVYFTDSSTRFQRRMYMALVGTDDSTGRLMKYNPQTKQVIVLQRNLTFPNGISLSRDNTYVLVVETTNCRILKYWLNDQTTPKASAAGTIEVLAKLPGFPDNIKRNANGEYWVGVYAKKKKIHDYMIQHPIIAETSLQLVPYFDVVKIVTKIIRLRAKGMAVKLNEDGEILMELLEISGKLKLVSEVLEDVDGNLWFGSVAMPFTSVYKKRL